MCVLCRVSVSVCAVQSECVCWCCRRELSAVQEDYVRVCGDRERSEAARSQEVEQVLSHCTDC